MATANATVKKVLDHLLQNGGGNSKLVEEWHEGTNWYRKWSSGFIEQGGAIPKLSNGNATIQLNKPFTTASYTVLVSTRADDSEYTAGRMFTLAKTLHTSYFEAANNGWTSEYIGITGFWYACGY